MPIDEPARAGFTKSGQPCSPAKSMIFLRAADSSRSHSRGRITTYGPTLQPEGGEHPLHVLLVLADGRGEHTRTDVRDTGELQEALEGAVLAVRAVQDGEDDVDLAERLGHRSGLAVDDFAVGGVDGEHHAALARLGEFLDVGVRRSVIAIRSGSSAVSAQRPSRVMPIGRTSYLVRSMAAGRRRR
jgi:hypothetical protein